MGMSVTLVGFNKLEENKNEQNELHENRS